MKSYRTLSSNGNLKAWAIGAALLALIGIWSAFVAWRADRTPTPATEAPFLGAETLTAAEGEQGEVQLARRIIVYQTTGASAAGTAEG